MAKITVIKKATAKAKPQGYCPILVDDIPMAEEVASARMSRDLQGCNRIVAVLATAAVIAALFAARSACEQKPLATTRDQNQRR